MTRFRRKPRKSVRTVALQIGCALALTSVTLWTSYAYAYPSFDDGAGNGCVSCHSDFASLGSLHQRHRIEFGITECNLCHPNGGGTKPVNTYWSGPGGGLGCAGCHGRDYGETSSSNGLAKATAYGLRMFHANNGVAVCATCHMPGALGSPNPFPPIFGEDVPPPYYGQATNNLTDPCASFQEDLTYDVDSVGLDNDGDGDADYPADSDCAAPETPTATPTATATPTSPPFDCGSGPIGGCVAPQKAILLVKEKKAGKEKLKLVLKKLETAVAASQFGNPVNGGTAYKICIYDAANLLSGEYNVAQAGAMCGDLSCWLPVSDKGYKYLDKSTSADGILKMKLLGGDAGKGKVLIVGNNKNSTMPLGVAAALQDKTSATVQVLSSDGSCFGATLPQVKKADGAIFRAVGP